MQMDGVEGLNTVGMWVREAGMFKAGDVVQVECVVIAPEIYSSIVNPGVKFELWDGGFISEGVVLQRLEDGWPTAEGS
jgi:hypothetical protein